MIVSLARCVACICEQKNDMVHELLERKAYKSKYLFTALIFYLLYLASAQEVCFRGCVCVCVRTRMHACIHKHMHTHGMVNV